MMTPDPLGKTDRHEPWRIVEKVVLACVHDKNVYMELPGSCFVM